MTRKTYRDKGRAVLLAAIMVLSVVAMTATFAAPAAAQATTDRTADQTVEPGGQVQISLTVDATQDINNWSVTESFSPELAGGSIDSVTVNGSAIFPAASGVESDGAVVVGSNTLESGSTLEIVYTANIPSSAQDGDTFDISGELTGSNINAIDLGTTTLTVDTQQDGGGDDTPEASVTIEDQTGTEPVESVEVASANASVDYVVAIHEDGGGSPGEIVGVSDVFNAGDEQTNFDVAVDGFTQSQEIFAMVHEANTSEPDNLGPALSDANGFLDSAQLTVLTESSDSLPELTSAVHYESNLANDIVLELGFDGTFDPGALDSLEVLDEDGGVLATADDVSLDVQNDRVVATVGAFVPAAEVVVTDNEGNTQSVSVDVARTTATLTDGETTDAVSGGNIALELPADQRGAQVTISGDGFGSFDRGLGAGSQTTVIDSGSDRLSGADSINVSNGDFEATVNFQPLGLNVDAVNTEVIVGGDIEADVSADRLDRDVQVQLLDSNGDEVASFEDTTSGLDGTLAVAFDSNDYDGDTGDFTVAVTDIATGVTVETDTVSVVEQPDVAAALGQASVEENVGDTASIPVDLSNTDTATVVVTIDGYTAEVEVTDSSSGGDDDDGQVTLELNTAQAGSGSAAAFSAADDGDSVTVNEVTDIGQRLPQDSYSVRVSIDGDRQDRGQLILTDRSTESISAHVAPSGAPGPTDNATAFLNIQTPGTTAAEGDTAAVLVTASGVSGNFDGFTGEDGVTFQLIEQDPEAFQDAETFTSDHPGIDVVPVGGDQYLIEIDTDNSELAEIGAFTAEFRVSADDNPYVDGNSPDDDEVVSTDFVIEPANAQFLDENEDGVYTLVGEEGVEVAGSTNLAPGTEVTVNVAGDTFFQGGEDSTVEVQEDGTFAATFDLSGVDTDQAVSVDAEFDTGLSIESDAEFGETAEADRLTEAEQLEQQIADLQEQLNSTEDQLSTVEDERAELQNELANAEATIGDLESQVSDLESQVSDLESTNSDLESQVSDLEGQLDTAESDLQTVLDELGVDSVDAAVDEIQNLSESGDSDGSGPGFGVAAALVALIAAALLAVRRRD